MTNERGVARGKRNKALLLCEQVESLAMAIAAEEDRQEKREEALVNAATALIDRLEEGECPLCKRAHHHTLGCPVDDLKAALR